MDCIVHGVAKSWTRLSDFHFTLLNILSSNFSDGCLRLFNLCLYNNDKDQATLQTKHIRILKGRVPSRAFPGGPVDGNSPSNAGDAGSIPGLGIKIPRAKCQLSLHMPQLDSPVQFSHSVSSNSLRPHEPQHARLPCPSPTPRVYPNSCPLSG